MVLPNFVVIGAMKSGTSTVYANLKMHPKIGMSKLKEPSFFSERYLKKDLQWYEGQFDEGFLLNGDSSPNYSKLHLFPNTAKRMFKLLPDAKIIYITRDPYERIISHLHHNIYRDRLKKSNVDYEVMKDSNYILTSSYLKQITEYLKYYDLKNFLFITNEELKRDLNGTMNKISNFLGVDYFDFSTKTVTRNHSSNKFLIKKYDQAKKIIPGKLMKYYHYIFYFLSIKIDAPTLSKSTENYIYNQLKDDIHNFCDLTGININEWETFSNLKQDE